MWLFKLSLQCSCFNSRTRAVQPLLRGVREGFIKGEALRLLRTSSSKAKFEKSIGLFKQRPSHIGYPDNLSNVTLPEVILCGRMSALQNKQKRLKEFCRWSQNIGHQPLISSILMNKWYLIKKNQSLLREIFQNPPLISYGKGRSLTHELVQAELWGSLNFLSWQIEVVFGLSTPLTSFLQKDTPEECFCWFPSLTKHKIEKG